MASFDHDVVMIGSGFGGGSVLRAAEKAHGVGVVPHDVRQRNRDAAFMPSPDVRQCKRQLARVAAGGPSTPARAPV